MMMTEERFKETNYKMSYEEYKKCCCSECDKASCIHRDAYRRLPEIDGGLVLCTLNIRISMIHGQGE